MGMNDRHTVQGVPNIGLQPTPPYGDEQKAMQQIVDRENYNPHHPQGDEQTIVVQVSVFAEFQPTSPHGDELMSLHSYTPEFITTHTPNGDEPNNCSCNHQISSISTHIHVWG